MPCLRRVVVNSSSRVRQILTGRPPAFLESKHAAKSMGSISNFPPNPPPTAILITRTSFKSIFKVLAKDSRHLNGAWDEDQSVILLVKVSHCPTHTWGSMGDGCATGHQNLSSRTWSASFIRRSGLPKLTGKIK